MILPFPIIFFILIYFLVLGLRIIKIYIISSFVQMVLSMFRMAFSNLRLSNPIKPSITLWNYKINFNFVEFGSLMISETGIDTLCSWRFEIL